MDGLSKRGPPIGFAGSHTSSVNSVFSEINAANTVDHAVNIVDQSTIESAPMPPMPQSSSATAKENQCLWCNQLIIDKSKSIRCSICGKYIHFLCAEKGSLNESVLRAMVKSKQSAYICEVCAPQPIKGGLIIEEKSGRIKSQELKQYDEQLKARDQLSTV